VHLRKDSREEDARFWDGEGWFPDNAVDHGAQIACTRRHGW
jgi:hypothetical protein